MLIPRRRLASRRRAPRLSAWRWVAGKMARLVLVIQHTIGHRPIYRQEYVPRERPRGAHRRKPACRESVAWGSETRIRSRGRSVVLVDQAAEDVRSVNIARTHRCWVASFDDWWGQADRAMGSFAVVVGGVGPERAIEMSLPENQGPIETLCPQQRVESVAPSSASSLAAPIWTPAHPRSPLGQVSLSRSKCRRAAIGRSWNYACLAWPSRKKRSVTSTLASTKPASARASSSSDAE